MLNFSTIRRLAAPTTLFVVPCLIALLMSIVGDGPERLGAEELRLSRGANNGSDTTNKGCDSLPGQPLKPCNVAGSDCSTCGTNATQGNMPYSSIGGAPGSFVPGAAGAGTCGNIWAGACLITPNGGLVCAQLNRGDTGNPCNKPQAPPTAQVTVHGVFPPHISDRLLMGR